MRPYTTRKEYNLITIGFLLLTTIISLVGAVVQHILNPVPNWLQLLLAFCLLYAGLSLIGGLFGVMQLIASRIVKQRSNSITWRMVILIFILVFLTFAAFILGNLNLK